MKNIPIFILRKHLKHINYHMKKTLLSLAAILAFAISANAQTSGGPDLYGYIWRDSNDPNGPTYNWIDVSSLTGVQEITGLADDNFVGPFVLPAPFPYYWYSVNKFWVGSNGYMSFGATQFAHPFPVIPGLSATKNNYLAPFMTDFNFAGATNPGRCYYWQSAAGDSVILSYENVPFWVNAVPDFTGDNSFQLILNYNDSTITFQYETQVGASASTADYCNIGIENNSGQIGIMYTHDIYPSTQYAIRFYAPASTTYQVNDAASFYNDTESNEGKFLSKNGNSFSLTSAVKNVGNTSLASFNVLTQVLNATNAIQVTNTTASNALIQGDVQVINQPNPFNPITAGIFKFRTTTQLAGDATPANDIKITELDVVDTTAATIELAYDNGISSTTTGISWSGGDGGVANLFIPPFYPCDITSVKTYIVADPNAVGYTMRIWDNSGVNGSRGNLLDSVVVAAGFVAPGFVTSTLTAPIRIDSAGFYVEWVMNGDGVALGQNQVVPFSNRSYEILGGTMSDYRYREVEDVMIRAIISRVGVGINENAAANGFSGIYPNPAQDLATINVDASLVKGNKVDVQIFDVTGKMVAQSTQNIEANKINISVKNLNAGIYTVKVKSGNNEASQKLSVIK
jgi:hypothetical protein